MQGHSTRRVAAGVLRGLAWSYASLVGVRLLVLVSTAVLARLVSPGDFGLVALALICTSVLDALRDVGVNDSLIVAPDEHLAAQADTAFWFTVLVSAALAALVAALSPLVAAFFRQPPLLALLAVLGLNLPLRSVGDTHYALAQRALDFRSRTAADVGEVVVRGVTGVGLALAGLGPWSLVVGYLSGTIVWTVILWTQVRWRPAIALHRAHLPSLVRFGGVLTVVAIIGTAMSYVDNLFIGRVLGATALGEYSIGFRLPEMLIVDVVAAAGLVLFPGFAMLSAESIPRAVVAAARYGLLLALPLGTAMIVLADPLVLALFGPHWRNAVPIVRILAIGFIPAPLALVTGSAYLARRRVDVMLKMAVPQGVLLVALVAVFVGDGIAAVAACQAGVRILFVPIGVYVSTRVLGLRARGLWNAAWPATVAAAGMAGVMAVVEQAIASPWPALLIGAAAGGVVYLGLARLLAGDALSALWEMVRSSRLPSPGLEMAIASAGPDGGEGVQQ